jgi:very-short-patch-repair endonuclease
MPHPALRQILDAAAKSHGVVPPELLIPLTRSARRTIIRSGVLRSVHPWVHVVAGSPQTAEQNLAAAVCATRGRGAASHRSAAWLWALIDQPPPQPELSIPPTVRIAISGAVVHRSSDLLSEPWAEVDGIPCTNPVMTLVDLGAVEGERVVQQACSEGIRRRLLTLSDLGTVIDRVGRRGRNGTTVSRAVLAARMDRGDSKAEDRFLTIVRRLQLPEPVQQHRLFDADGHFVAQLDFAWPAALLGVEIDGYGAHSTPEQLAHDLTRQNRILAMGWELRRYAWVHLTRLWRDTGDELVEALRRRGLR